jgi:hypothetical protein
MLLLSGCAPEGAPFPSSFEITGPGQFQFVARGNWFYPANTDDVSLGLDRALYRCGTPRERDDDRFPSTEPIPTGIANGK